MNPLFQLFFMMKIYVDLPFTHAGDFPGFECPKTNGFFPDPDDCESFYVCEDGRPESRTCPNGLEFHRGKKNCDFPAFAGCVEGTILAIGPHYKSGVPTLDIQCETPTCPCIYVDVGSCARYYRCENGVAYKETCSEGLLMNRETLTCDYEENVDCDATPTMPNRTVQTTAYLTSESGLVTNSLDDTEGSGFTEVHSTLDNDIEKQFSSSGDGDIVFSTSVSDEIRTTINGTSNGAEQAASTVTATYIVTDDAAIGYGSTKRDAESPASVNSSTFTPLEISSDTVTTSTFANSKIADEGGDITGEDGKTFTNELGEGFIAMSTRKLQSPTENHPSTTKSYQHYSTSHTLSTTASSVVTDSDFRSDSSPEIQATEGSWTTLNMETSGDYDIDLHSQNSTGSTASIQTDSTTEGPYGGFSAVASSESGNWYESSTGNYEAGSTPEETNSSGEGPITLSSTTITSNRTRLYSDNETPQIYTNATIEDTTEKTGSSADSSNEVFTKSSSQQDLASMTDKSQFYTAAVTTRTTTNETEVFNDEDLGRTSSTSHKFSDYPSSDTTEYSTMDYVYNTAEPVEAVLLRCTCENCRFADATNCSLYYNCEDNYLIHAQCPPGELFNSRPLSCDSAENVHCVADSNLCTEKNGFYPHDGDCRSYIQCQEGTPYHRLCPYGLHYNRLRMICDLPSKAKCGEELRSSFELGHPDETASCDCSTCVMPDAEDCNKYYLCLNDTAHIGTCSDSLRFNPAVGNCDFAKNVICPNAMKQCTSTNGYFKNSRDCSSYFHCVGRIAYRKECPQHTHFSEESKTCVDPCDAKCNETIDCGTSGTSTLNVSEHTAITTSQGVRSTNATHSGLATNTIPSHSTSMESSDEGITTVTFDEYDEVAGESRQTNPGQAFDLTATIKGNTSSTTYDSSNNESTSRTDLFNTDPSSGESDINQFHASEGSGEEGIPVTTSTINFITTLIPSSSSFSENVRFSSTKVGSSEPTDISVMYGTSTGIEDLIEGSSKESTLSSDTLTSTSEATLYNDTDTKTSVVGSTMSKIVTTESIENLTESHSYSTSTQIKDVVSKSPSEQETRSTRSYTDGAGLHTTIEPTTETNFEVSSAKAESDDNRVSTPPSGTITGGTTIEVTNSRKHEIETKTTDDVFYSESGILRTESQVHISTEGANMIPTSAVPAEDESEKVEHITETVSMNPQNYSSTTFEELDTTNTQRQNADYETTTATATYLNTTDMDISLSERHQSATAPSTTIKSTVTAEIEQNSVADITTNTKSTVHYSETDYVEITTFLDGTDLLTNGNFTTVERSTQNDHRASTEDISGDTETDVTQSDNDFTSNHATSNEVTSEVSEYPASTENASNVPVTQYNIDSSATYDEDDSSITNMVQSTLPELLTTEIVQYSTDILAGNSTNEPTSQKVIETTQIKFKTTTRTQSSETHVTNYNPEDTTEVLRSSAKTLTSNITESSSTNLSTEDKTYFSGMTPSDTAILGDTTYVKPETTDVQSSIEYTTYSELDSSASSTTEVPYTRSDSVGITTAEPSTAHTVKDSSIRTETAEQTIGVDVNTGSLITDADSTVINTGHYTPSEDTAGVISTSGDIVITNMTITSTEDNGYFSNATPNDTIISNTTYAETDTSYNGTDYSEISATEISSTLTSILETTTTKEPTVYTFMDSSTKTGIVEHTIEVEINSDRSTTDIESQMPYTGPYGPSEATGGVTPTNTVITYTTQPGVTIISAGDNAYSSSIATNDSTTTSETTHVETENEIQSSIVYTSYTESYTSEKKETEIVPSETDSLTANSTMLTTGYTINEKGTKAETVDHTTNNNEEAEITTNTLVTVDIRSPVSYTGHDSFSTSTAKTNSAETTLTETVSDVSILMYNISSSVGVTTGISAISSIVEETSGDADTTSTTYSLEYTSMDDHTGTEVSTSGEKSTSADLLTIRATQSAEPYAITDDVYSTTESPDLTTVTEDVFVHTATTNTVQSSVLFTTRDTTDMSKQNITDETFQTDSTAESTKSSIYAKITSRNTAETMDNITTSEEISTYSAGTSEPSTEFTEQNSEGFTVHPTKVISSSDNFTESTLSSLEHATEYTTETSRVSRISESTTVGEETTVAQTPTQISITYTTQNRRDNITLFTTTTPSTTAEAKEDVTTKPNLYSIVETTETDNNASTKLVIPTSKSPLSTTATDSTICSKEGEYYSNKLDCRSFYRCHNGSLLLMTCPESLHFSPTWKHCEEPCTAGCNDSLDCSANIDHRTTESPTGTLCRQTGLFSVDSGCGQFVNCTENMATLQNCAEGLHFNVTSRTCDWPANARCGSDVRPLTRLKRLSDCDKSFGIESYKSDCSMYQLCLNGAQYLMKCSTGLLFDETSTVCTYASKVACEQTTSTSTTSTTKPEVPRCPRGNGMFRDPKDCGSFIHCSNWIPYKKTCPANLHFSEITQNCEYPCDAKCDRHLVCSTSSTTTPSSSTSSMSHHKVCPCINCLVPNPDSCTSYFECKNGKPRRKKCPRQQMFNPKIQKCDWDNNVNCPRHMVCPQRNGLFEHPSDCNKFLHCSNGFPYVKKCPSNLEFDIKYKRCEWPAGRCEPHAQEKEQVLSAGSQKMNEAGSLVSATSCPKPSGLFRYTEDCSKFLHCVNYNAYVKSCPPPLLFNSMLSVCDWPRHVDCSGNQTVHLTQCQGDVSSVECPDTRLPLPDEENCSTFYDCTSGKPCRQRCPEGLHFNKKTSICDLPRRANCSIYRASMKSLKESLRNSKTSPTSCTYKHGLLEDPTNKKCFYRCIKGVPVRRCCPRNLVFNVSVRSCRHKSKDGRNKSR